MDLHSLVSDLAEFVDVVGRRIGLSEAESAALAVIRQHLAGLAAPVPVAPNPNVPVVPAGGQGNETQATFPPAVTPLAPVFNPGDGGGVNG